MITISKKIADDVVIDKTKNYIEKYNANNAALVAIDPKTGQVLAMVGSRDYFDDSIQGQVNVAISLRQPGSSIKPIVYASLFEKVIPRTRYFMTSSLIFRLILPSHIFRIIII